ncbi:MAG: hypothetical protein ABJ056_05775 [Halioglobus sp.]
MNRVAVFVCAVLTAPLSLAGDISGFWKHVDEPGWIEIRLVEGKGTVMRNDKFPERVGREIVKELQADGSKEGLWRGLVYAERLGEYKDAEISLKEPDLMQFEVKVGFMSRTIEWMRVDTVPAAMQ